MPPKIENVPCKLCQDSFTKKDKAMSCDICEKWQHCKCMDMSEQMYNFYKINESAPWVCKDCIEKKKEEKNIHELLTEIGETSKKERSEMKDIMKGLGERMVKMEDEQNKKMKEFGEQINRIEGKIEEKIKENMKNSETDIMLKLNHEMEEKLERFKRRNNLIIYGLPECKNGDEDERLRVDTSRIDKLFRELEVNALKINIQRLGNKITEKPRPIKIELENEATKYKILKKAGKIKTISEEELKQIIISGDMTLKQRELDKILREELKERRLKGEKNIKIKNGKIVNTENQSSEDHS